MPHFTLTTTQSAAIIDLLVGVSFARQAALVTSRKSVPPVQRIRALVDTGASLTFVDPKVFAVPGLESTGSLSIFTPSTGSRLVETSTFDVSVMIPNGGQPPLVWPNIQVASSVLYESQGYHALIGRDVLSQCLFSYNGSAGQFTLAY